MFLCIYLAIGSIFIFIMIRISIELRRLNMNLTLNPKLLKRMIVVNNKAAGEMLRNKRLKLGITQQELAKQVNVSQAVISNVENGLDVHFSVWEFTKALKVNPKELLVSLSS